MRVLKLRFLILLCLIVAPLGVSTGSLASSDENTQDSQAANQENAESDDQSDSRGFDPCLLNPSLAVCANKQ